MGSHAAAVAEVIGIDHLYLTVSSLARAEPFYDRVLHDALGFRKKPFTLGGEPHVHYYNRLMGTVLRPARAGAAAQPPPHDRYAPGLHHLCLRVDALEDVARVAVALQDAGIAASEPRLYPEYAPDYCATFLDDPDG